MSPDEDEPDPEAAQAVLEWIRGARPVVGLLHFEKTDPDPEDLTLVLPAPRVIT